MIGDKDFRRRLGRFVVRRQMIEDDAYILRKALADVIVVRAEMRYDIDGIEYTALSEKFAIVPKGLAAPTYNLIFDQTGARIWSWLPLYYEYPPR